MSSMSHPHYDLVVVGAGIVGLATAWTASQRGLRVAVVDRNAHATGASVRNFGFITVTGQRQGAHWLRARKTLEIWKQLAPQAGIQIVHQGLYVLAQRPEAADVLEAFLHTEMGEGCRLFSSREVEQTWPMFQPGHALLYSPHECRVESRDAIKQLTLWLQQACGIDFFWQSTVTGISLPQVWTSRGELKAHHCVVCPGNDFSTLFPEWIDKAGVQQCTLQMMRVVPRNPMPLPGAVMSDLSLVRYEGYADLAEAAPLKARLQQAQSGHLAHGVHLIVVQSADGSLVVGDSHVYGAAEAPFARTDIDALILSELHRVLRLPDAEVQERWTGSYASAADVVYKVSPAPRVVLGMVTGGTGASTSFAFAEELVDMALAG